MIGRPVRSRSKTTRAWSRTRTSGDEEGHLKRAVGALDLTALGIGAVIGTGIFVIIGEGIGIAGPAVILSFVLAAVTCVFSALCYAELASSIPVSGSAYTYAYATLGELVAWIIGWDLVLEYGVSVAAVAVGWGGNLNEFLDNTFGWALPDEIATSPEDGGIFNLPAVFIVLAVMVLLSRGVRETAKANFVMVIIKIAILLFFIVVAFSSAFNTDNLEPFAPDGVNGAVTAASVIFFAYIGFDAVSTGAEEAREPKRDLPLAIIGSLDHLHDHLHPRLDRRRRLAQRRGAAASPTRRWPPCSRRAPVSAGPPASSRSARWSRSPA